MIASPLTHDLYPYEHVNVPTLVRFAGLQSLEDGPELIGEIIDIFLRTTPQTFSRLERAVGANDLEEIRRTVHSLKGTVGTFGALKLADLCRELDREIKEGKQEGFSDPVADILYEYACVCDDLQAIKIAHHL